MVKNIFSTIVMLIFIPLIASSAPGAEITAPVENQIVQGLVDIKGTITETEFKSAELDYRYTNLVNDTWFAIGKVNQPVTNSVLAVWDTTTISDGDYSLRLTVFHKDGTIHEAIVNQVMVRNYTPFLATSTIEPAVVEISTPLPTRSELLPMQSTAYPKNKAALSLTEVNQGLVNGTVIGILSVFGLGIYTMSRNRLRHK